MKSILGFSGYGNATDKERGHDISSVAGQDPEWQKVSGVIGASSTTPLQFIWEVNSCLPPTFQIVTGGIAHLTAKIYACVDRLARPDQDQTESADVRAAHWQEITAAYLVFGSGGATAAPSTSPAAISNGLYFPTEPLAHGFRPVWIRLVITPDGTQGADKLDLYSHGTDN